MKDILTVAFSVFAFSILATSSLADESTKTPSAIEQVRLTIDEIVQTVQSMPGEEQAKIRRDKLRVIINPRFDFEEMAKRSLGAAWKDITPEEQKDFVSTFSDLLSRTYLNRIETVKPGMVKIDKEEALPGQGPESVVVKTLVTNKGDTFPINYKLLKRANNWQVYDVVIENIGLVANYRNEFAGIIRKDKFEGLMQKLRDKNKNAN